MYWILSVAPMRRSWIVTGPASEEKLRELLTKNPDFSTPYYKVVEEISIMAKFGSLHT